MTENRSEDMPQEAAIPRRQTTAATPTVEREASERSAASSSSDPGAATWGDLPLRDVYRATRLLVKLAAAGLVLVFGYLELNGEEYASIASSVPADTTFRFALALYYASWVSGLLVDTSVQEGTYSRPPAGGRMPASGFVTALVLATAFGILCYWADTPTRFAALLAVFMVINVASWRYLVDRILPPTVAESRVAFESDYFKLERLKLVYEVYLKGRWQWTRFGAAAAVLAFMNVLVHAGGSELLVACVILSYVVLIEAWTWFMRLQIAASIRVLDHLRNGYVLVARTAETSGTS